MSDYRTQPQFSEKLEPEFYSDHDSFLLILKNLNYGISKTSDKNKQQKTSDKNKRQKISEQRQTKKTLENIKKIKEFLQENGESKTNDIATLLVLSPARTRAILATMEEVEALGDRTSRTYRLKN